ncbi:hypothetical protein LCGC14_1536290, partial [marine sediment metagenome]
MAEYQKIYRQANLDRIKERELSYGKKYYRDNKERVSQRQAKYYRENRETMR